MIISRRKYEEAIAWAKEEGKREAYREMDEQHLRRYMIDKVESLEKEVERLKKERRNERKTSGWRPTSETGPGIPPDMVDI